jgi:hypothetical protein
MDDQTTDGKPPIILVPDRKVQDEFGKSRQAFVRWDNDPALAKLGWPAAIVIQGKKHRPRHLLEAFKSNLISAALEKRAIKQGGKQQKV